MTDPQHAVRRHHHITLCVGDAQEDYDFHTKVLDMKSVKKTALYDGTVPIYHLYYGNDMGDESTLITCFPMRQSGRMGRRGSGQVSKLSLSVPTESLSFWDSRLHEHGIEATASERFGEKLLEFSHPCGLDYELVGVPEDDRVPHTGGEVAPENGIRGTHGITVSVHDFEGSMEFMEGGWNGRRTAEEGDHLRYEIGDGGSGRIVDFVREPDLSIGSWTFGEGTVHHCAFQVDSLEIQDEVKGYLEGLGYTDVSDRKDRGYFDSVYVRTPGGALFEATVSKSEGFLVDEPYATLGHEFQVPPVFADQKDWIMEYLDDLEYSR
jgi:glyoxalase family protein